jgi:hypothetical protein
VALVHPAVVAVTLATVTVLHLVVSMTVAMLLDLVRTFRFLFEQ